MLRYAADYNKAGGTQVDVTWVPTDYGTKLNAALAAGTGPDVYEDWITTIPSYARNGNAAPLDDIFTPAVKSDYNSRALDQVTYNGKIYGLKIHTDLSLVQRRAEECSLRRTEKRIALLTASSSLVGQRQTKI